MHHSATHGCNTEPRSRMAQDTDKQHGDDGTQLPRRLPGKGVARCRFSDARPLMVPVSKKAQSHFRSGLHRRVARLKSALTHLETRRGPHRGEMHAGARGWGRQELLSTPWPRRRPSGSSILATVSHPAGIGGRASGWGLCTRQLPWASGRPVMRDPPRCTERTHRLCEVPDPPEVTEAGPWA